MALTTQDRPATAAAPPGREGPLRSWWRTRPAVTRWTTASWVAIGGATTVIALHEGTSGGRVLRAAASLAVTALGALALRRLPERWAAWSGLGVGLVGSSIGLGIAARHLHPVTALEGAAALVAAAAGALALVAGAGWLLRRARGSRKLAALPVAVVVLALLWPSTVAVMVTNTGPTPLDGASPGDVGLAYEDVSMVIAGGVHLDGWYVAPSDGAVVVLRHGSGSNRATLLDHAAVLAGAGYGVLAVDARGARLERRRRHGPRLVRGRRHQRRRGPPAHPP